MHSTNSTKIKNHRSKIKFGGIEFEKAKGVTTSLSMQGGFSDQRNLCGVETR